MNQDRLLIVRGFFKFLCQFIPLYQGVSKSVVILATNPFSPVINNSFGENIQIPRMAFAVLNQAESISCQLRPKSVV